MRISIQQFGGAEPWTLEIDPETTLSDLKTVIRDAKGIKENIGLQLLLNEKVLGAGMDAPCKDEVQSGKRKRESTLQEYGFKEGIVAARVP